MKKTYTIGATALLSISVITMAKEVPSSRARVFTAVTVTTKNDVVVKSTPAKVNASISPIDINGDSIPDYAVDYEKFSTPAWCGTGGCRYQLWLSQPGGRAKLIFDRQMRSLKTRKGTHGTIFDFDFHGGNCGGAGSDACAISFAWNVKSAKLAVVPSPGKKAVIHRTDPIDAGS